MISPVPAAGFLFMLWIIVPLTDKEKEQCSK